MCSTSKDNPVHTWHLAFHSGMSSNSDLRAAIAAKVPVGVVATLLSLIQWLKAIPDYLDEGGKVFVDSGAFAAFQKNEPMDWGPVIATYDRLIDCSEVRSGLSIVAPDVIGDQAATVALWGTYASKVREWIDAGARVIVPLQRGERSAGQMLELAKMAFGTDQFCAGIPSNLEAMTVEDCGTIHHHDIHVLGRVAMTAELREKMDALRANNPDATFTADANWLRSRLRKISAVETQRIDHTKRVFETRRTQAVLRVLETDAYGYLAL